KRSSTEPMPRWASTASQPVGSATIASAKPWPAPRKPAMQRASLASSSLLNRNAASPPVALAAAISPAAAPLMSHAPSPMARSPSTRRRHGSALHAGESGTVSRCTLNTRRGLPRTASNDTAPSPWSVTSQRKSGNCARMYSKMPPVPIRRGGFRVSNATSASRWRSTSPSMAAPTVPRSLFPVPALAVVDLRPQRRTHPEQPDEPFRLFHAPVRALRVGGRARAQDVRGLDRDRVHAAAARLQQHLAVDGALRRRQERLQVDLQRIVPEALVDQFDPPARDLRLEAVLLLAEDRLLERAVRGEQRGQARRFVHDPALEPDGGVAGVQPAADAVLREHRVEARQQLLASERLAVQRDRFAALEAQPRLQRLGRPLLAPRAPAARALARRPPVVDLAAGQGHAEQVLVDGVGLLLRVHGEAALLEVGLLVGAGLRVLLLDLADRGHDRPVAGCPAPGGPAPGGHDGQVETHLVVAHAG